LADEQCSCAEDEQGTSQSKPSCSCHSLNDELLLEVTELAHKYALDEMQFQCEEKWMQRLNPGNVYDCLYYAELFQLYSLKLSCTEMVNSLKLYSTNQIFRSGKIPNCLWAIVGRSW
jgi:hypothetical protein